MFTRLAMIFTPNVFVFKPVTPVLPLVGARWCYGVRFATLERKQCDSKLVVCLFHLS